MRACARTPSAPLVSRAWLLLALCVAALFSLPATAEAKITYVKPLWQPVSEWSPPEEREEHAELHSAAMKLYSEYVETSGVKPCTTERGKGNARNPRRARAEAPMSASAGSAGAQGSTTMLSRGRPAEVPPPTRQPSVSPGRASALRTS